VVGYPPGVSCIKGIKFMSDFLSAISRQTLLVFYWQPAFKKTDSVFVIILKNTITSVVNTIIRLGVVYAGIRVVMTAITHGSM
jgi:hypothetical protein